MDYAWVIIIGIILSIGVTAYFVAIFWEKRKEDKKNKPLPETPNPNGQEEPVQFSVKPDKILNNIKQMIMVLDRKGTIISANQEFLNRVNKPQKDVVGKNYRNILTIFTVDYHDHLIAEKDLQLTESYGLFYKNPSQNETNTKQTLIIKGGLEKEDVYVEVTTSPITLGETESEKVEGSIVVINDITDKIQQEKLKLDFASMAAHEFRTPLTAIKGYIDGLRQEAWNDLNEDQHFFIERAETAIQNMSELMENMLSIAKIERGTYVLNTQKIDWIRLINRKVDEFQPRLESTKLKLIWNPPTEEFPRVLVDEFRIAEVVTNLISNAIKYTPEGSITITVDHDQEKAEITTNITDTGQGIPEEEQNKLFEKFFEVPGNKAQGAKSTGLGLYISKKIVELHGGKIWLNSKPNEGSRFSFTIPTENKSQKQQDAWKV